MMYQELIHGEQREILDKTAALTRTLQKNLNNRLDDLIFRAVASETTFNSEKPHASNVISIVQVSNNEINLYKGDTRIMFGSSGNFNHIILVNAIVESTS